jgi:integrase
VELYKKRNSKYWWYDFTIRGQRFRGSAKETNESRARKIAALRFADACENSDPLPRKAPTLHEVSGRFLKWVDSARLVSKTKTYYQDGWRLISTTSILGMRLDAINNDVAERLTFTGSAANANCALRTLRRILHKTEEWKLIRRAPKIKLLPEKERSLRLDEEAEQKLLAGAAKCDWRPQALELFRDMVILVRDTGMRNEKELYQIRIENINWDRRLIFVPDSKTVNGIRDVPMSDRVLDLLRIRCGSRRQDWVFPSKRSKSGSPYYNGGQVPAGPKGGRTAEEPGPLLWPSRLRDAGTKEDREPETSDGGNGTRRRKDGDEIPTPRARYCALCAERNE